MSHAADLARRIAVAHREPGYLRLALPPELCRPEVAGPLERGMAGVAGVSAARFDAAARQLALRHDPAVAAGALARQLYRLLEALPDSLPPGPAADAGSATGAAALPGVQELLDRLRARLLPPGDAPEGSLNAKLQPLIASALTEKAVFNFLNDLTVFYLIKAHWELITKRWLKEPLAHGSAWLTTFYLLFLLIRYRKSP